MIIAILAITGFQVYWLTNNYDREKQSLDIKTNASFRETVIHLQASKLKLDRISLRIDSLSGDGVMPVPTMRGNRQFKQMSNRKEGVITMINLLQERIKDSIATNKDKKVIVVGGGKAGRHSFDTLTTDVRQRIHTPTIVHQADSLLLDPRMIRNVKVSRNNNSSESVITVEYDKKKLREVYADSVPVPKRRGLFIEQTTREESGLPGNNAIYRFLYDIDSVSIKDSVTIKEVSTAFILRLKEDHINVPFTIYKVDSVHASSPNAATIGFMNPVTFELSLGNSFAYMLNKLKLPILFSLLLIGITIVSFVLLYRNMIRQQRLSELKNDFISNITHELKTPIATVGVAIEALKNFNAIDDPARTREYLDISQNELQRLNLLVDKVLKLSIFEKKEIELKKEVFDLRRLTEEVMNTMKLQFEKYQAKVSLQIDGDLFLIEADKLHITSVIYNLLDNALKYSAENPVIDVQLKAHAQYAGINVKDNGIGIPPEYKGRIFEKFFRVPTGNRHNIKGYGLGLSYVSEVVKRHHGFITVESEPGKGSVFSVRIPLKEAGVIQFDEHRKIRKEI
jgi:two-component system phosphate regulon sensor histidine kinase PhoR